MKTIYEKLKVSVVIPNWNGKYLLKNCLSSLNRQTFKNFEVIVVDNGSTDGSMVYLKKFYPGFKIIELNQNTGFAAAVNLGIKAAKGEHIVLINNDTEVDKDCLKFLVQSADRHPDVGMVAAKMLQFQKRRLIDSAGGYIDVVGHADNIGRDQKDSGAFNKPKYIFLVSGGGGLFKKKVFEKVGLFDEDYFAYFEDVDLCLRAQFMGFKAFFEPRAKIYHMHKATSNKNRALTEYLQFRNMTMTVIKNFPRAILTRDLNWLKIILVNINTIRYLARQGYLLQALKAEVYIIVNLLKLLKKRKKIQLTIRVKDEYIISNIKLKKITLFGLLKKGF